MKLCHPISMNHATTVLNDYPELYAAVIGISEGKLPNPETIEYDNYINRVLIKCPELKDGLTRFLKILASE